MSKIKIEDIRKEAEKHNWKLISDEYKNLDTELIFECDEGHRVYAPYKKVRDKWFCPICQDNAYKIQAQTITPKKKGVNRVIGLDQATHISGYSVFDNGQLVRSGIFQTELEDEIERDNAIKTWVVNLIQNWKPDVIGLEDIQLQQFGEKTIGVTTYKVLAHLQGILMEACYEQGVSYVVCAPATWRSYNKVTGRTKSDKKKSMQRKVKELFDISVTNDEADAIGIGKYVADTKKKQVEIVNWE